MKIYKCDICGKTVKRPLDFMLYYPENITNPNKLEMMIITENGDIRTELSFDLCEDCSKYIYNCLKGFKEMSKFKDEKEYHESTNKSDS